MNDDIMRSCTLCPRMCRADRTTRHGFCGEGSMVRAAKAYLHKWEEPCISGTNGSGTVFFTGCPLRCCFCQNHEISSAGKGAPITDERLGEIFLELQTQGAHNINLVTGTHFVPNIINALDSCGDRLNIPVAFNCGGYERTETIELLRGYCSVFMPDFKYCSDEAAVKYSSAPGYAEYCIRAIEKMIAIAGSLRFDENGLMQSGVIVRHLVLPGHYRDSLKILDMLSEYKNDIMLSLMCQYTPCFRAYEHKELSRRVFTYEYEKVRSAAADIGFQGYEQERSSAQAVYTPLFDLSGIL